MTVLIFKNEQDLMFVYSANSEIEKDNAVKDYFSDLLGHANFPENFENKLKSNDSSGLFVLFTSLYSKGCFSENYYIEHVMEIK